jgi:hypothetical protein
MFETRNHGNESLIDNYREMRRYGATASEAHQLMKGYRSVSSGDYYNR